AFPSPDHGCRVRDAGMAVKGDNGRARIRTPIRGAQHMTSGISDTGAITRRPGSVTAVLAGGCFWGMEDLVRRQPGVLETRVGYTGGDNTHATYRNHPGDAEALEIVYDPSKTTYRDILAFFFQIHDPSTLNRQGNDIGTSYRSAIFPLDTEQERIARATIADVDASGLWPGAVVTTIEQPGPFWEAEPGIRTTCSGNRTGTPATSRLPAW